MGQPQFSSSSLGLRSINAQEDGLTGVLAGDGGLPGLPCGLFCASFTLVDHSCEKCGAAVEDGRPFCPQCRAPQIHVEIAIPAGEAQAGANGAIDAPSIRFPLPADFARSPGLQASLFDRGVAVRAALKAGVLGVFISMIPVLGVVLTGCLAVYLYRRERGIAPAAAAASRLGGAAGVVSFAINSALIAIRVFVLHAQQEYIESVLKIAQAVGYNPADPEIQAAVHNLFTPSGMALTFFFGMIFTVALAALGGAVAAVVMRRPPGA